MKAPRTERVARISKKRPLSPNPSINKSFEAFEKLLSLDLNKTDQCKIIEGDCQFQSCLTCQL